MQLGHGRRLVSGRTVAAHGGGGRTEMVRWRWRREVGRLCRRTVGWQAAVDGRRWSAVDGGRTD